MVRQCRLPRTEVNLSLNEKPLKGPVTDRALQLKDDRVRIILPTLGSTERCRLAGRSVVGSRLKDPSSPRKYSHGGCLQVRPTITSERRQHEHVGTRRSPPGWPRAPYRTCQTQTPPGASL